MRDDYNIHTEAEALRNGMQAPKCKRMRKTHLTADERSCGYHSSSREEQFEVVKLHRRMRRWRNLVVFGGNNSSCEKLWRLKEPAGALLMKGRGITLFNDGWGITP